MGQHAADVAAAGLREAERRVDVREDVPALGIEQALVEVVAADRALGVVVGLAHEGGAEPVQGAQLLDRDLHQADGVDGADPGDGRQVELELTASVLVEHLVDGHLERLQVAVHLVEQSLRLADPWSVNQTCIPA